MNRFGRFAVALFLAFAMFVAVRMTGEQREHVKGDPWFECSRVESDWLVCRAEHVPGPFYADWSSCSSHKPACDKWDRRDRRALTVFLTAPMGEPVQVVMTAPHVTGKAWTVRRVFK